MPIKIILAGEGGQGIQLIAKIISTAANFANKFSSELPSFGVEQRGGVSLAYIQISSKAINYPRFNKADIIVAFSNRSITTIKPFIHDNTLIIYDNSAIETNYLDKIKSHIKNYVAVSAQKIAQEKYVQKSANMIMLGALSTYLKDINFQDFENAISEELKDKIQQNPNIKSINIEAFKNGLQLAQTFDKEKQPFSGCNVQEIKKLFVKENISWTRFPEYCKGCALCIIKCPVDALKFSENTGFLGNPLPIVDMDKCIGCLKCEKICPDAAIKVEKK